MCTSPTQFASCQVAELGFGSSNLVKVTLGLSVAIAVRVSECTGFLKLQRGIVLVFLS